MLRATCARTSKCTLSVSSTSRVIAVAVIVGRCPSAVSARTPTPALAKARARVQLPARRKRRVKPNGETREGGCRQDWRRQGFKEQEVQEARTQERSVWHCLRPGYVQQHNCHHHRPGGQHAQLEELRIAGLSRFAQGYALRGAAGCIQRR